MSDNFDFIKGDWIYDIETYPNVFTLAIASADGKESRCWEVSEFLDESDKIMACLRYLSQKKQRMIGFNNLGFDYPVLHKILEEAVQAKRLGVVYKIDQYRVYDWAMAQIQSARDGWADKVKTEDEMITQLDLFKINHFDNKAKMTSLKLLEFNMRLPNIEDLPFPVGKILTREEIQVLKHYNMHDVQCTKMFYHYNVGAIRLRENLSEKYNFDCLNLSDTDIGTRFFMSKIEQINPEAFYIQTSHGRKKRQTKRKKIVIKDCLFDYVHFKTPEFKALHEWFKKQVITETKGVFSNIEEHNLGELAKYCQMDTKSKKFPDKPTDKELKEFYELHPLGWIEEKPLKAMVNVLDENGEVVKEEFVDSKGNIKYRNKKQPKISYNGCYRVATTLNVVFKDFRIDLGVGGLHGAKQGVIKKSDTHSIMSYDVASMYPNIAIANRVYPEHLGEEFCDSYEDFYNERKKFPKGTAENLAIKLGLNSVYGKSNDQYSVFLDPMYTMKITINGQLSLCMLMESIVTKTNSRLIMANTDGFEFLIEKDKEQEAKDLVTAWEKEVGLQMELVMYDAMYIRDVNNYMAMYSGGGVKKKGAYEYEDLAWHKNFSALIVPMTVDKHINEGKDVKDFIMRHEDPFDFMLRVKLPRSNRLMLTDINTGESKQLQNICRYYPAKNGGKMEKVMPPLEGTKDERVQAVEANYLVKECNNMNNFQWDIDYDYYVSEVNKLLEPFEKTITWSC